MSSSSVRVASAQYQVSQIATLADYEAKIARWVSSARADGVAIAAFPEYSALEAVSAYERRSLADRRSAERHGLGALPLKSDRRKGADAGREARIMDDLGEWHDALFARLAKEHGLYVLAPSIPRRRGRDRFENVSSVFGPDGKIGEQSKLIPTAWEREVWGIQPGNAIEVFDTPFAKLAITICFDTEFPQLAREFRERGAEILFSPTCTDSMRGYHRVRIAAQARGLENLCYVVQPCTVGSVAWSQSVGRNVGLGGIFTVPDLGPNSDGVVALGSVDFDGWVSADLDIAAVRRIRLANHPNDRSNWQSQFRFSRLGPERLAS
jgi:predicted amidohydrolase